VGFSGLLGQVSISSLRSFQLFEQIKIRTRLVKLNAGHLRNAAPRLWARLGERDEDLAAELAQAILVSRIGMVIEALDLLGIPHQNGFFSKEADLSGHFTEGWQARVYAGLKDKYPSCLLVFYINHLGVEAAKAGTLFSPPA
jgi:hypothetical protein